MFRKDWAQSRVVSETKLTFPHSACPCCPQERAGPVRALHHLLLLAGPLHSPVGGLPKRLRRPLRRRRCRAARMPSGELRLFHPAHLRLCIRFQHLLGRLHVLHRALAVRLYVPWRLLPLFRPVDGPERAHPFPSVFRAGRAQPPQFRRRAEPQCALRVHLRSTLGCLRGWFSGLALLANHADSHSLSTFPSHLQAMSVHSYGACCFFAAGRA